MVEIIGCAVALILSVKFINLVMDVFVPAFCDELHNTHKTSNITAK